MPQGVEVQFLSRAQYKTLVLYLYGAHSLMVELQLVELVARVRFSLGTQVSVSYNK